MKLLHICNDYYTDDAFDVYYSMFNTDAEIVYTGMGGYI